MPGEFSFFNNTWSTVPSRKLSLAEFMGYVRSGRWRAEIERGRACLVGGDEAGYKAIKKRLPAVTPGGVFAERKVEGLVEASGLFVLDFDAGDNDAVQDWGELRGKFSRDPRVAAAFLSPRGDGLKVFFRYQEGADLVAVLEGLKAGICAELSVVPDRSGKDICRLCYVSYDPEGYVCADPESLVLALPYVVPAAPAGLPKEARKAREYKLDDDPGDDEEETDEARFVRYMDLLASEGGALDNNTGIKVVGAAVAFWGAERALVELRRRWPAGDEKVNFAYKVQHAVPCDSPEAMLCAAGKERNVEMRPKRRKKRAAGSTGSGARNAVATCGDDEATEDDSEESSENEEESYEVRMEKRDVQKKGWDMLAESLLEPFYYDQGSGRYYYDQGKDYVSLNGGDVKTRLHLLGISRKKNKYVGLSAADYMMDKVRMERYLHYVGNLAGKMRGHYRVNGANILALSSPHIVEPKKSDWGLIKKFFADLTGASDPENEYGKKQEAFLFAWLKVAYESLVSGSWRPGQVLILAGPPSGGKSLLKLLITEILGGRMGEPYDYLSGVSRFNSDLAGAEVLAVDDVQGATDIRVRRAVAGRIKNMLFAGQVRVESKGRDAFYFTPFWRMIMCVNNEPENLLVLPVISEDIEDKVALIKCGVFQCPLPFYEAEEKAAVVKQMIDEIPGLLWMLTHTPIREADRNERTGVKTFHNPELLAAIGSIAPENELLGLIDEWHKGQIENFGLPQTWTANEWKRELTKGDLPYAREASALLDRWTGATGSYLGKLSKTYPERVKKGPLIHGTQRWEILPDETQPPPPEDGSGAGDIPW